jgi:hypothetical protein
VRAIHPKTIPSCEKSTYNITECPLFSPLFPEGQLEPLHSEEKGELIIPVTGAKPERKLMSRFICKIALEALAYRQLQKTNKPDEDFFEFMHHPDLDPIRQWARYSKGTKEWSFHERKIYDENQGHPDQGGSSYQVLHEFDFLGTDELEIYFCLAIFGFEYTINMGGDCLEGYREWLVKNQQRSPLYPDSN